MHEDHNEERIDEIIPRILENLERRRHNHMTHREYIDELSRKQDELQILHAQHEQCMCRAKQIEQKSVKLVNELNAFLTRAKIISGNFKPDDIIAEDGK